MAGGGLSDQQLKEFDDYLSGVSSTGQPSAPVPDPLPLPPEPPKPVELPEPPKPEPKPFVPEPKEEPAPPKPSTNLNFVDEIINLHQQKVDTILGLLDKIDARSHKDIVADLVDEMQYQKQVIKREKASSDDIKKLMELADQASK